MKYKIAKITKILILVILEKKTFEYWIGSIDAGSKIPRQIRT